MPRIHITPVVLNLMILNALVFVALNINMELLYPYFILQKSDLIISPRIIQLPDGHFYHPVFQPVQLVTAFFSHEAIWHIFMNMFALYNFGVVLETVMGARRFLFAYLTIGVVSTAIVAFLDPSPYPMLGASGALFGMAVLYAWYFPKAQMGIIFLPFRFAIGKFMIGAAVLSAGLIIAEYVTGKSMGGISHFGHLSGMVVGFVYLHIDKLRKITKR